MANTCSICLENYTALLRAKVTCPYCPSHSCRGCVQRYLLTSYDDPHCMGCRKAWNREFIDTHLTKTFRSGTLRKHRAKILCDREKALLPAMQVFVQATISLREVRKEISVLYREDTTLLTKRNQLVTQRDGLIRAYRAEKSVDAREKIKETLVKTNGYELAEINATRDILNIQLSDMNTQVIRFSNILAGRGDTTERIESREFIQRCPAEGCRGYLSTAYKCGTCSKYACSECLEVKGLVRDVEHTCKEDAKATAALIRRETKPCPKCGVRIYKIDGCDQMWCTQEGCQTAFSWTTGRVVTGTIHNPHYYEFLRQRGGGAPPREAGDIPCGGVPTTYVFTRMIAATPLAPAEKTIIYNFHRCINDIVNARLPDYQQRRPANANMDINIHYLMNEIDEDTWKKTLEQRETRFERKKEIGQILQMFGHVGAEFLRALEQAGVRGAAAVWTAQVKDQVLDLRTYTNKSLVDLGKRMMCAFPQIDKDWFYIPPRKEAVNDNPPAPAPAPLAAAAAGATEAAAAALLQARAEAVRRE